MTAPSIATIAFDTLRITPKTEWHFLQISDADGRIGFGEATLNGRSQALADLARERLPSLSGGPATLAALGDWPEPDGLVEAALRSAADMALLDLEAQAEGCSLAERLGGRRREVVELYANINRRSVARTPECFADSARLAMTQDFSIFKIAPFDEVSVALCAEGDIDALIAPGLERMAAVREAIGEAGTLRIDCHWRFDPPAAKQMIAAAAEFQPDWIECPLPETDETIADLAWLRAYAASFGIRLAGLETKIGVEAFRPYLEAGAYDVVMPDVKYLGGLGLFAELAALAEVHGAVLSPHNPSGPICHGVSLQVAATLPHFDSLEMQFDESPHFTGLILDQRSIPITGKASLGNAAGSGLSLNEELVAELGVGEHSLLLG